MKLFNLALNLIQLAPKSKRPKITTGINRPGPWYHKKPSIIVCAYNRVEVTEKCLTYIKRFTPEHELICVDDGSTDNTIDLFKKLSNKWVRIEKNSGVAHAKNAGLNLSTGDPIIFIDNDIMVNDLWIYPLYAALGLQYEIGIASGIPSNEPKKLSCMKNQYGLIEVDETGAAGMAIKREVFDIIGGFDDDLNLVGEDTDLCFRARLAGYKIVLIPSLILEHKNFTTRSQFSAEEINEGFSKFISKWAKYEHIFPEIGRFRELRKRGVVPGVPATSNR